MFNELDVMFLDEYDYEKTKEKVFDVFRRYEKARFQFIELSMPKITTSYDINYDCPVSKVSKPTEKVSFLLLDKEEKLEKFYTILSKLSEQLNYFEKCYLVCCLLQRKNEDATADLIGISKPTFGKWKKTCIIKCGLSFGIAVSKSSL